MLVGIQLQEQQICEKPRQNLLDNYRTNDKTNDHSCGMRQTLFILAQQNPTLRVAFQQNLAAKGNKKRTADVLRSDHEHSIGLSSKHWSADIRDKGATGYSRRALSRGVVASHRALKPSYRDREFACTYPLQYNPTVFAVSGVSRTIFGRVSAVIGWEWADRSLDVTQIPRSATQSPSVIHYRPNCFF